MGSMGSISLEIIDFFLSWLYHDIPVNSWLCPKIRLRGSNYRKKYKYVSFGSQLYSDTLLFWPKTQSMNIQYIKKPQIFLTIFLTRLITCFNITRRWLRFSLFKL